MRRHQEFKGVRKIIFLMLCFFCVSAIHAATHYVVTNGTPGVTSTDPYTNWATAGTNIIDVVNAAMTNTASRTVWVSNGTYYLTNQISITNELTIRSVNGREVTIVDGNYPTYINRCFNLTITAVATLDGFTVRNGYANGSGGGIFSDRGNVQIINCRITANTGRTNGASNCSGNGIYIENGVVSNCEIIGNFGVGANGGGVYAKNSLVAKCIIAHNILTPTNSSLSCSGGGIVAYGSNAIIDTCEIYGNTNVFSANGYAGGVWIYGDTGPTLRNSYIHDNISTVIGGVQVSRGKIQNCTVVSNYAGNFGGGMYISVVYPTTVSVENVICYLNTCGSASHSNTYFYTTSSTGTYNIVNSCMGKPTSQFPTNGLAGYYYTNNLEANPQFVNKDMGDWRLSRESRCINAGINQSWMSIDLDGHRRIDRYSGIVDMGCYEYIPHGTFFSVP